MSLLVSILLFMVNTFFFVIFLLTGSWVALVSLAGMAYGIWSIMSALEYVE